MDTPIIPTSPDLSDDESRKKYIRTFAGDMEIVKQGGSPDLQPLEATPPAPFADAKETILFTPSAPLPEPAPAPIETPIPPPPPAPMPEPVAYREPVPAPPPPVRPAPPIQFPEPTVVRAPEINASPLETYSGDFLDKVKNTDASTATLLAAEADAGTSQPVAKKKTSGWTIFAIIAGVVLLIGGGVGAYIGYTHYAVQTAPVVLAPTISAPIFVDAKEEISGNSPAEIQQAILASVNEPLAPNTVRLLYTTVSTTTGNDVFSALQLAAPGILLRNINAPQSMAGIVNSDGGQSPFFILSVASYQDTFAGMLSWEPTMTSDLSALFPPYPMPVAPIVATTTVATTTTSKTKAKTAASTATSTPPAPVVTPAFHDEIVDNHDVRIYLDAQGNSVLIYGYWNKTTLVIARDPDAFIEILGRLATSNTQ